MMTSRPRGNARLDPFVRSMAQRIARVETALRGAGQLPGEILTGHAARATGQEAVMSPDQQSLLWGFALLVARCPADAAGSGLSAGPGLGQTEMPSPRLQQLLRQIGQARERSPEIGRAVDDLQSFVMAADIAAVIEETAGRHTNQPLVHFFEVLLAHCNTALRRHRGVYFTPRPVVQFIVRSVDRMLRSDLGVAGGLSAPAAPLRVIDPACGSGAFLLGVVEHVHQAGLASEDACGNRWTSEALAERLTGIDLMPACCGAAELLMERELATHWSACQRNPLSDAAYSRRLFTPPQHPEPPHGTRDPGEYLPLVIGNPPYRNFGRRNRGTWILDQLNEYKAGLGEKKLNLDDDFIKFLRWAQYWIDQAGRGVLAMITNNTYLTGITHRQMRASLRGSFDRIYILDLHGSRKKRESSPEGAVDENVFPIQQGVAIGLFVKSGRRGSPRAAGIDHAELWGSREEKLHALSTSDLGRMKWTRLATEAPYHFFVQRNDESLGRYREWCRLDEIFDKYISGVQTKRDALFSGFTQNEVASRMDEFLHGAARGHFASDVPEWLRRKAAGVEFDSGVIRPYMVAPFDVRWVYYEPRLLGRARHEVMQHLEPDNMAIVFMRQTTNADQYDHFLVTNVLVSDRLFYSAHGAPFVAPLFLCSSAGRVTNLNAALLERLAERVGLQFVEQEGDGWPTSFDSRDVLHWMYGVMFSRAYRTHFQAQLRIDFPRIPLPTNRDVFRQLSEQGRELAEAHLSVLDGFWNRALVTSCGETAGLPVERGYPRLGAPGRVAVHRQTDLSGQIEAEVWQFRIGGYQVLARWLKQRRHRELSAAEQEHFQRIAEAIRRTLRWMASIEPLGW